MNTSIPKSSDRPRLTIGDTGAATGTGYSAIPESVLAEIVKLIPQAIVLARLPSFRIVVRNASGEKFCSGECLNPKIVEVLQVSVLSGSLSPSESIVRTKTCSPGEQEAAAFDEDFTELHYFDAERRWTACPRKAPDFPLAGAEQSIDLGPADDASLRLWCKQISTSAGDFLLLFEPSARTGVKGSRQSISPDAPKLCPTDPPMPSTVPLLDSITTVDALTGLPDRRILETVVEHLNHEKRAFSLVFVDLDGFKSVNDRWGHLVGDRVLSAVAARLRKAVRPADTVVRYGGDEFAMILVDISAEETARATAERILGTLSEPLRLLGGTFEIAASAGVAINRVGKGQLERLLEAADRALYAAKREGGRCVRVSDS